MTLSITIGNHCIQAAIFSGREFKLFPDNRDRTLAMKDWFIAILHYFKSVSSSFDLGHCQTNLITNLKISSLKL